MLGMISSNIQTGILTLAVILLIIVSLSLFFTHREVRDMRTAVIKNRHNIQALQNILNEAGMVGMGVLGPCMDGMPNAPNIPNIPNIPRSSPPSNMLSVPEDKNTQYPTHPDPEDKNTQYPTHPDPEDIIPIEDVEVITPQDNLSEPKGLDNIKEKLTGDTGYTGLKDDRPSDVADDMDSDNDSPDESSDETSDENSERS